MAIQPKTFQSELPTLLTQLLGQKTTTSASTSANTAPLQQVFQQAMQPMDTGMYEQLIKGIAGTAAQQIPELTAALANATGSRSSNNSPLALALGRQSDLANAAAAQQILSYNQNQTQNAVQAARGMADATRSSTQTQKQSTGTNPLIPLLGGTLLNQFDKRGGFDKVGDMIGSGFDSLVSSFSPAASFDFDTLYSSMDAGMDGGGMGFTEFAPQAASVFDNFSDFGGYASDALGGVGDFFGGIGDSLGGFVDTAGDYLGDFASSVGDFFGFADGGMPGALHPRGMPLAGGWNAEFLSPLIHPGLHMTSRTHRHGYADGGRPGGLIPARANATMDVVDAATRGQDPNAVMQRILLEAMMPKPVAPPPVNPMNFLRYLLPTSGFNIYQYGDGGMAGMRPGYADGGIIRNRNYLGQPAPRQGQGVINFEGGRPPVPVQQGANPNRVGNNTSTGSNGVTAEMLSQMISDIARQTNQGRGQGTAQANRRATAGGDINAAAGNPMGAEAAAAFGGAALGMTGLPGVGMVGSALGVPTSPMGLAKALASLARRENEATDAIATASDPLGAFTAALSVANPTLGINMSDVGMTNAVAAANAISAINRDIDPISALIGITNNFAGADTTAGGFVGDASDPEGSVGGGGSFAGSVGDASDPEGSVGGGGFGGGGRGGFGGSSTGGGGDGTGGDGGNDGGGGRGTSAGGGNSDGEANGGLLRGPGTGTSDSIKAISRVPGEASTYFSNGEFVVPRDTVEFYGPEFFEKLLMKTHSPVRR